MFFIHKKTELDLKLDETQKHFENNYKDNARNAYNESLALFDKLKAEGKLKEKEIARYQKRIDDFAEKMEGYTHYNHIGW